MATKMTIRMKSGDVFDTPLDKNEADSLSAEDCAERFFDKVAISELTTLRVGPRIIFMREVESFEFA